MLRRVRTMSEQECYARLYGGPRSVEAVRLPGRRAELALAGEKLRRLFEERLDQREAA